MPTIEELLQWTPEQRAEYYIAEVCQALNITPDEVHMGYKEDTNHVNEDARWRVYLTFQEEYCYDATYYPRLPAGSRFEIYYFDGYNIVTEGEGSIARIKTAIMHNRNARRVAELEAKIKLLEANTAKILPQPIGEALLEEWH